MTALNPAALSQQASITLVRGQLASDTSDDVCLACHELSGGNPFLLVELLDQVRANGEIPDARSAARLQDLAPESGGEDAAGALLAGR